MDPAADFLWRALPCGGPEVAAFICELSIPSWAVGPRGCLLTELPSLTVLYIPEQSALELTSDCGLDGTKRIACKGNADHEKMLKELRCVIPEDLQDPSGSDEKTAAKPSTASDYETTTFDEDFVSESGRTTKSWTSNTINSDVGTPTRHRRETEDTLSPVVSTKSSFKQTSEADLSWHQDKTILTTSPSSGENQFDPTSVGGNVNFDTSTHVTAVPADTTKETKNQFATTTQPSASTLHSIPLATTARATATKEKNITITTQSANIDDYPSAINQGQLFSIIENGTMFDIIELNETEQEANKPKQESTTSVPTKKPGSTKKPIRPTKKAIKLLTTTAKPIQNVDELEENLTKEFEMMPEIHDTSLTLNRTFRKEPPPPKEDEHSNLETGSQFGVPRVINFTVTNSLLEPEDEELQADQPSSEANNTDVLISREEDKNGTKLDHHDDAVTLQPPSTTEDQTKNYMKVETSNHNDVPLHPIDPRLYILNGHHLAQNNQSEPVHKSVVSKEDFLPKTLIGESSTMILDNYTEHPFPSDEPKKINRHRSLHASKPRKFYPYFFSRMLG
ncbi:uncharacterized protein LOC126743599 isoform X2 [Anthonomus grandis grandis]|nr:uncharacterized protein LOC126743599 isoform X2 [Anthonomus grandis grandis]